MEKSITLLGATGSIGKQTLDAVRNCLPDIKVEVLTGFSNINALAPLVDEFRPKKVWVPDSTSKINLEHLIKHRCEILIGDDALNSCAVNNDSSIVVNALVGKAGLKPTLAAINAGKNIALANKETLVTAGSLVMGLAREKGVKIIPIDSEHSAILQCLNGSKPEDVEKIILTASGGPFRTWDKNMIKKARAGDALKHPNWSMGSKITIDSATLMNKGLELIEAMWLFNKTVDEIDIVVHPQSIIHSMVQYIDGSVIAQLGMPDMRLPILYAIEEAGRVSTKFPRLDFLNCGSLSFESPDEDRFPCLVLAKYAAKTGGTLPAVMNYINEWAVGEYLKGKLDFYDISRLISQAFDTYTVKPVTSVLDIVEAEAWADEFCNAV